MDSPPIEENFNAILVLPPSLVLLAIIFLVGRKRWRRLLWDNKLITGLVASLVVMNILEVLTYGNLYKNYDLLLRAYYGAATVSASIFLCLSERLNAVTLIPGKLFSSIVIGMTTLLVILIFFSDLVIQGYSRTSYTILRVPGDYYWVFQLYDLVCITFGPYLIFRSIRLATNPLDKKRHIVILYSLVPILAASFVVIFLMQLGFAINFSIVLPVCTLIFLVVYLFTENKRDLFRFLVNIPYSPERAAYKQLNQRVIDYISKSQTDEKLSLKEMMNDIETSFVANALEIKDGNHNLAADLLSVSLSTIYRHKDKGRKQLPPGASEKG